MAFANLFTFLKSLLSAQTLEPEKGVYLWSFIGGLFQQVIELVCALFYGIVKWILALVDFLQYFVQKLIGLDYWLNSKYFTFEGAIENDVLFSFLFNDTVQNVFRALCGVFIVLLIVFTIFAIIRSEWQYITGDNFGDGKNSKTKIFREAMKAVAMVLIFPLVMIIGVISSNAILASLVKALSIDMGSTFGATLFYIGSQNANKYKIYADGGVRSAVSDQVTFYITPEGKQLVMSSNGMNSNLVESVNNYGDFVNKLKVAKKYTVNSMFDIVNPMEEKSFSGYCVRLSVGGEAKYYMVKVPVEEKTAMYYYLRNVLQVPIMNKSDNIGSQSILSDVKNYMEESSESLGYIRNLNLNEFSQKDAVLQACYNTWSYSNIYKTQKSFESAIDISVLRSGYNHGGGGGLSDFGIDTVSNAKIMYNSNLISSYFDGGMFGAEQLQAEYSVMGEIVDFMNNNGVQFYILDATSPLVKWDYSNYQVGSNWLANFENFNEIGGSSEENDILNVKEHSTVPGVTDADPRTRYIYDGEGGQDKIMPLLVSYSEECNDAEQGNVLYIAKEGVSSELEGSVYILCVKQTFGNQARYLPVVNGLTYENPVDKSSFKFKSDYYASNYRGVVIAKGTFSTASSNGSIGLPTYLASGASFQDKILGLINTTVEISDSKPYYYEMVQSGGLLQYAAVEDDNNNDLFDTVEYTVKSATLKSSLASAAEYTVVDDKFLTDGYFYFAEKDTNKSVINQDLMQSLSVELQTASNETYIAEYAGQYYNASSTEINYLYVLTRNGQYFVAKSTSGASPKFEFLALDGEGSLYKHATNNKITAGTQSYNLFSTYSEDELVSGKAGGYDGYLIGSLRPDQMVYNGTQNGKTVFRTESMEYVPQIKSSQYINVYFNTTAQNLVSVDGDSVNFASPVTPELEFSRYDTTLNTDVYKIKTWNTAYMQNSTFYTLYLYNFYTARVDAPGNNDDDGLWSYHYGAEDADKIQKAERPTPAGNQTIFDLLSSLFGDKMIFSVKINGNDFEFHKDDDALGLYDGGTYVGTIYKPIGTSCSNKEALPNVSTSMYFNDNKETYYNINTSNTFTSKEQMKLYYENLSQSFVTSCIRDNFSLKFLTIDFHFSISNIRIKGALGLSTMNRADVDYSFKVSNGVKFDYFFDTDIKLQTFFVPSKISYWIILIAAALIIKVLGTSIWGVVKRFYEITLYYLAMPAVASTIPLDNGSKFKTAIQEPLISKVLMTYGVILGLNLFFVLLAPVKEVSNVFTAEDIATSGSYFLKHLPISYKMLNLYCYILFVLVAFTMINALPTLVSNMVTNGKGDLMKTGAETKGSAEKALKDSGDVVSGRAAMDAGSKAFDVARNAIPGSAVFKGISDHRKKRRSERQSFEDKGRTEAESELSGGGKSSSREDEQESIKQALTENQMTDMQDENGDVGDVHFGPGGGPKQDEKIPTGQPLTDEQIEQAIKQGMTIVPDGVTGGFIALPGGDNLLGPDGKPVQTQSTDVASGNYQEVMQTMQNASTKMALQGKAIDDSTTDELAKRSFNESIDNKTELLGQSTEETIKNVVKNNIDTGNKSIERSINQVITNSGVGIDGETKEERINLAMFGGKDASGKQVQGKIGAQTQVDAILSTMSEASKDEYKKKIKDGDSAETKLETLNQMGYSLRAKTTHTPGVDDKFSNFKNFEVQRTITTPDGKQIVDPSAKEVKDDNVLGDIKKQVISNSSAEEVSVAVAQSGSNFAVNNLLSQNIVNGIDGENFDGTSAVGSKIVADMLSNEEYENQAILKHLSATGKIDEFKENYGLTGDITKGEEMMLALKTIGDLKTSTNENMINGLEKSDYEAEVVKDLQEMSKNGVSISAAYNISAWEMKKSVDEEGAEQIKEEVKAEVTSTQKDLTAGLTEAKENAAIATAAQNIIDNIPEDTKKYQDTVFASVLTSQDLNGANLDAIKAISGKATIEELSNDDKALIGFIKTKNGTFTTEDGGAINEQEILGLKKDFTNDFQRDAAYQMITDEQKVKAFKEGGQYEMLKSMINNDSTIAINKLDLIRAETDYIRSGKLGKYETQTLSVAMANEGLDLKTAENSQIDKFLQDHGIISKIVRDDMKSNNYDFDKMVNENFEKSYLRTQAQTNKEMELSKEQIERMGGKAMLAAITNTEVVESEEKYAVVDKMLSAYKQKTMDARLSVEFQKLGFSDEEVQQMIQRGHSQRDIEMAYEAAKFNGDLEGKKGKEALGEISVYLADKNMTSNAILKGMQAEGDAAALTRISDVIYGSDGLTTTQKENLISVSTTGLKGFAVDERNKILTEMAKQDGQIMSQVGPNADDATILRFLNHSSNKQYLDSLNARASNQSYYQLRSRYIDGKNNLEIFNDIKTAEETETKLNRILETESESVSAENMRSVIMSGKASEIHVAEIADTYARKVNIMGQTDIEDTRRKAMIQEIEARVGVQNVVAGKEDEMQDRAFADSANAAFEAFGDDIRASDAYKAAKKAQGKNFDENEFMIDLIKNDKLSELKLGKTDAADLENTVKRAQKISKEKFAIEQYIENPDSSAAIELDEIADNAVVEENKQRIALGLDLRTTLVAEKVRENSRFVRLAREKYARENGGAEFELLDKDAQDAYLAQNYEQKLSKNDITDIEKTFIKQSGVKLGQFNSADELIKFAKNNGQSVSQVIMDQQLAGNYTKDLNTKVVEKMSESTFNGIIDEKIKDENVGEGTGIIKDLRRKFIETEYEKHGDNITVQENIEKMSAEEKSRFNFNKNILQQEMRGNDEIIANIFKNTNMLNNDDIVLQILAKKNFDDPNKTKRRGKGTYEGELEYLRGHYAAGKIDIDTVKQSFTAEDINTFMNAHEDVKNNLTNIAAVDMTLALDKESLHSKQVESVLANNALKSNVADKVLETNGVTQDQVKDLIRQMLQGQDEHKGKSDTEIDLYINQNFTNLKTELSMREIQKDKSGNITVGDKLDESKIMNQYGAAVDDLSKNNKTFGEKLHNEVTKGVSNPANVSDEDRAAFFAPTGGSQIPGNQAMEKAGAFGNISNIKGAFDNFLTNQGSRIVGLAGTIFDKTFVAAGGKIKQGATMIKADVQKGVKAVGQGIKTGAKETWKGIKTGAKTTWRGIKTGAKIVTSKESWAKVGTGVKKGFKFAKDYITNEGGKRDLVNASIMLKGKQLMNKVDGALDKAKGAVNNAWTKTKGAAQVAWTKTKGTVKVAWTKTTGGVKKAYSYVTDGQNWAKLGKNIGDRYKKVKGKVGQGLTYAKNVITNKDNTRDLLKASLITKGIQLKQKADQALTKAGGAVKVAWTKTTGGAKKAYSYVTDGQNWAKLGKRIAKIGVVQDTLKLGKEVGLGIGQAGKVFGLKVKDKAVGIYKGAVKGAQTTWTGIKKAGKAAVTADTYKKMLKGAWTGVKKGVSVAGRETGKAIVAGAHGVVYKITKKLPNKSASYDNWNKTLEKKIQAIRAGEGAFKNMSVDQRKAEIEKIKAQKIDMALPKDFGKMTLEQQTAYMKQQNLNKYEAFNTKNFNKIYKPEKVVKQTNTTVVKKFADKIGYKFGFKPFVSDEVKEKHKQDLAFAKNLITRYNSSAPMRNKEKDFGQNFSKFAANYLSETALKDMTRREGLMSDKDYNSLLQQMNSELDLNKKSNLANQLAEERQRREDAMARRLNNTYKYASKKVAKDNKVDPQTYLEEKGVETKNVRYKDGSKKYRQMQSRVNLHIPIPILGDAANKVASSVATGFKKAVVRNYESKNGKVGPTMQALYDKLYGRKTVEGQISARNKAELISSMMQKFAEFTKNFKGDKNEFEKQFKQQFGQQGIDIYNKYQQRNTGLLTGKSRLEDSPLAVQQREIMKQLEMDLKQATKHMEYPTNLVSAPKSIASQFVGKGLSNAKTQAQKALDKTRADELNKALNMFNMQKNDVNFNALVNKLPTIVKDRFKEKYTDADLKGLSDNQKKKVLERYIEKELKKALSKVHNNNFMNTDKSQLQKLNGTYVRKDELARAESGETIKTTLKSLDSKVYEGLTRNVDSASNKVRTEQLNLDDLARALKRLKDGPQNSYTRGEIQRVLRAMNESRTRLNTLNNILHAAESRKRDFERSIAAANDRAHHARMMSSGPIGASNRDSVLDNYNFIKDGRPVRPGTVDARQIEQLFRRFMATQRPIIDKLAANYKQKIMDDLRAEINRVRYTANRDFGKNLRDIRKLETKLKAKIVELKSSTNKDHQVLARQLEVDKENLIYVERNLINKLREMGVNVSEITKKY